MENYTFLKDDTFIIVIDFLRDIKKECTFIFTKHGIKIHTLDDNNTSIIDINLLDVYSKCNFKKKYKVCLELDVLQKVLNSKEKDEKIKIKIEEDNFILVYYNDLKESQSEYKLPLIDIDEDEDDDLPDIELEENIKIKLDSKYFTKLCKKIKNFDESIKFKVDKNNQQLSLKTGNNNMVELKLIEEKEKLEELKINENINVMFLIKMITNTCRGDKLSENVTIILESNERPALFIYKKGDNYIKHYISPQIEEDDY